ncbi:MAG: hypothetical protein L6437_11140 [Kiritimatiellae bacterium]|nr:hypothetical protein [Kiritimatiellia bacterium]
MRILYVLVLICPTIIMALDSAHAAGPDPRLDREPGPFVIATDYPDLQAAIDALPDYGGTVYIPSGQQYVLTMTLDMTRHKNYRHISLIGQGYSPNTCIIIDTKDKPGIDLTGNGYCTLSSLRIQIRSCSVGILMARKGDGQSAGWHVFRDIMIDEYPHGDPPGPSKALVASLGSEVNRYYNCVFLSHKPGITGLYVSGGNELGLKSPYADETRSGCNTELRMYGCSICMWGADTYNMQLIGQCLDVSIHGGYFSVVGTAAIRMDGARGPVGNITIDNVRIEAERAQHIILSAGNVHNVTINQGQWICGWGEPILYVSDEKKFGDPGYQGGAVRNAAHTWRITDTFMAIYDDYQQHCGMSNPKSYPLEPDGYVQMRFSRLVNSDISGVSTVVVRFEKNEKGVSVATYPPDMTAVVVEEFSRGNTFSRLGSQVILRGDAKGNWVDAMAGDVRRLEVGAGQPGTILNLCPQNVNQIARPKAGDTVLENAAGRFRLAVYDGKQWVYAGFHPE